MSCGTVLSEIEIELIILLVKSQLVDTCQKLVVVVLSLASADDLSDSRNQTVDCRYRLAVLVHLHVKCLDLLRIVRHKYRTLVDLLCQIAFMLRLKIRAPGYLVLKLVVVLL